MHVHTGDEIYIGKGAQIGEPPNDASAKGRSLILQNIESLERIDWKPIEIGDRSIIREGVNIDLGINRITTIGEEVYIHSKASINHDCIIEDRVVIGPNACLNGSVIVQKEAQIGAMASLHQNIIVGSCSMIGMGCAVMKNVPPYVTVAGNPQIIIGLNNIKIDRDIGRNIVSKGDFKNYLRYCVEERLEEFIEVERPAEGFKRKLEEYLSATSKR